MSALFLLREAAFLIQQNYPTYLTLKILFSSGKYPEGWVFKAVLQNLNWNQHKVIYIERTEKWNINPHIRLQMFLFTKIFF